MWAAVLTKGKLVIFDSNSDFLPEDVTGNDLWLHRQRALVTYLKNEGRRFDVWVGGKGNNDQEDLSCVSLGAVVPHSPIGRIGQLAHFFPAERQYRPIDQLVPN